MLVNDDDQAIVHSFDALHLGPDSALHIAWIDGREGKKEPGTFSAKRALNVARGTFPDHPQMAVDGEGRLVVVWEEQSPVRREVVMSHSLDRGATFSKPVKLNEKKGQSPVVAISEQGLVALAWLEHAMPGHRTVLQTAQFPLLRTVRQRSPEFLP